MKKTETWDNVIIRKDKAGEWRWTRVASNGEIIGASTEGYKNRADCENNFRRTLNNNWVYV